MPNREKYINLNSYLILIVMGLGGWNLKATVDQGNRLSAMEPQIQELRYQVQEMKRQTEFNTVMPPTSSSSDKSNHKNSE